MRYLLIGNYGVGNLGDEALKEYFLESYSHVHWDVVSASPERNELPRLPFGVRSLCTSRWWRTIAALRQADGVVFGGGTLFTDVESVYACMLWWWHVFWARFFQKPCLFAFQGIGPFRTTFGAWFAKQSLQYAAYISVRDRESKERAEYFEVNRKVVLSFDPVFSKISPISKERSQKVFVIIPRRNSGETLRNKATELQKSFEWDAIHVLSLQPEDAQEQRKCAALQKFFGEYASIHPIRTLRDLVTELSAASLVLSERYHGALVAFALQKPLEVVLQGDGDKIAALPIHEKREELLLRVKRGEQSLKEALRGVSCEV